MTSPVDLANLRGITDGDVEMEQELFREFIITSDSYIESLSQSLGDDRSELWRTTAHSFKGIALNLGAAKLGELCKKAQESNAVPTQEKTTMLESIKQEYTAVKGYLNSIILG